MRLFVLARNYQEFKTWCWEKGIPELHACYVANAERITGIRLTEKQIVRLPGHRDNINWTSIEEAIAARVVSA